MNYIADTPPDLHPIGMDPVEQTLAAVTATAGAPGLYSTHWSGDESYGNELYFFGLTSGPDANLIIVNTSFRVVPEPAPALLVCIGLAALSVGRRRSA